MSWLGILAVAAALGSGIVAGVFFAFSTFIMAALDRVPGGHGMVAMQQINRVILRSPFMPVFLGTALLAAVLAAVALFDWRAPGAAALLAGGLFYAVGGIVLTLVWNVPLNVRLDAAANGTLDGEKVWHHYLVAWTRWNHVRTIACAAAAAAFTLAVPSM